MSKRGENIYKRKDGRWEGRYIKERSADGKARYAYVYGKSYAVSTNETAPAEGAVVGQGVNFPGLTVAVPPSANLSASYLNKLHR